ncbi:AAA family ATPase [Vitreimonas flagellata]|uniref:AAA family ATPase n=1 Tax=Vitreimonas flagellata TaxID=2560861 RepID=UPI00143126E3|nr:MoxR family ATPase [Vitreimonas flagellata]
MNFRFYIGDGERREDVRIENTLITPEMQEAFQSPRSYVPSERAIAAVNVALSTRLPLLIGGEPGTGKTELGAAVAHEMGKVGPIKYIVKSTSQSSDLFYNYDAIQHFHASQTGASDPLPFITYHGLGLAILLALPLEARAPFLPSVASDDPLLSMLWRPERRQSVVIIDEIDKAPRDFPNDLLDELANLRFRVAPLNGRITPPIEDETLKPIVFLTTNSERQLPNAFLRRCAYLHMPVPDGAALQRILQSRFEAGVRTTSKLLETLVKFIETTREHVRLERKPSTAELLDYAQYLRANGAALDQPFWTARGAREGLSLLGKTPAELAEIEWLFDRAGA